MFLKSGFPGTFFCSSGDSGKWWIVSQQWLSGECIVSREVNGEYIVSREMMDCITAWLNSEYTGRGGAV